MISIFSLIFKSPEYAQFVYDGIMKNTQMIASREAEFYFVVNFKKGDSEKVVEYLKEKNYPHFIYDKNPDQPNYPANISDIYKSWNFGVSKAKGDIIVMLNSDMFPCCNHWLEDMLEWYSEDKILTPRLVESGRIPSIFPHTLIWNFGRSPGEFQMEDFMVYANMWKQRKLEPRGLFMPLMMSKKLFLEVGGFPEGNINGVSGDQIFFYERLKGKAEHLTPYNVLFYHIQEGESRP